MMSDNNFGIFSPLTTDLYYRIHATSLTLSIFFWRGFPHPVQTSYVNAHIDRATTTEKGTAAAAAATTAAATAFLVPSSSTSCRTSDQGG